MLEEFHVPVDFIAAALHGIEYEAIRASGGASSWYIFLGWS